MCDRAMQPFVGIEGAYIERCIRLHGDGRELCGEWWDILVIVPGIGQVNVMQAVSDALREGGDGIVTNA